MRQFEETLYDGICQQFRIDKLYYESKTDHQHLMIFHNAHLGRVMTLDGVVQTTEADEFIYHEMLTHVPILAHGHATRVLVIGGGDGGIIREVFRHPTIEHATQVEIDRAVVDMAVEYLPNHSAGAFDDPRLNLVIADGMDFVRNSTDQFDVIIVDSTDPIGPGEILFSAEFYESARQRLLPGGVMVTQNGVPFFQVGELQTTYRRLSPLFGDCHFYCAPIPTYYGGFMAFGWATDNKELRGTSVPILKERFNQASIACRYYNPEIHSASFALPQYFLDAIAGDSGSMSSKSRNRR